MGRAYEVRKASIQKTGAIKAKTYSTFAKEIYLAAKGNPDPDTNATLKRIMDKAKKNQIPNDIINRAIEKAKGNSGEDYKEVIYEGFGPGASTLIIKTLTDNVNRTVGFVRAAFNKVDKSLGVNNSVSYNYDHLGIVTFKCTNEDELLLGLLDQGIEPVEFENIDNELTISVKSNDFSKLKDILDTLVPQIEYEVDEIGMYPKEEVILNEEDQIIFDRLYNLLDDVEDVTEIYHNVKK